MNIKKGLIYCHFKNKRLLTADSKNLLNLVLPIFKKKIISFFLSMKYEVVCL